MEVLLVEDSEVDAWLTGEVLQSCGVRVNLNQMSEGNEALNCLMKLGPFQQAATPDLILLDLNMPGMDGFDFLYSIKQVPFLRDIPVVILTTSALEKDIDRTFQYQAVAYLEKPLSAEEIVPILQNLSLFSPSRPARG
jgi:chemotaxis family two-component system response regulator Rcp1